ncbi:unnamed protein product [Ectocarpus sp. CCAP 1310/34]|nr:unnamed protein product [Ectocarpus sp. CCAP 1310/34]
MSMMPVLVLGPALVYLWEERSKETKGVKNQASGPCNTPASFRARLNRHCPMH